MKIAGMVERGSSVADIGTDHGFVPIYLINQDIAGSVIAMDIKAGPLERAKEHIKEYGLEKKIAVRLSDGLQKLAPEEADTVIIAGMGGQLIIRILSEGTHVTDSIKQLILSPQSDLGKVRAFLNENGFKLIDEDMLFEDGKYYTVMKFEHGYERPGTYIENKYGRILLSRRAGILCDFLNKEKSALKELEKVLSCSSSPNVVTRIKEINKEIEYIDKALAWEDENDLQ
jgi:tRNA (adenine22-N1)-methyltransferase